MRINGVFVEEDYIGNFTFDFDVAVSSLLCWKIEKTQIFLEAPLSKPGPRTGGTVYGCKAGADPVWPENSECQQLQPRFVSFSRKRIRKYLLRDIS